MIIFKKMGVSKRMRTNFVIRAARSICRAGFIALAIPFAVVAGILFFPPQSEAQQSGGNLLQNLGGAIGNTGNGMGQNINPQQDLQNVTQQPAVPNLQTQWSTSRLEKIMSSRAGTKLNQFGYEELGTGRAVTIPQAGAVQDDYLLGSGDELVISLRGQENSEFRVVVDRNGQVLIPRLNPIVASGRSFGEFRRDLADSVRRAYISTSVFASIAWRMAIASWCHRWAGPWPSAALSASPAFMNCLRALPALLSNRWWR
jgi:hypothetical protein